MFAYVAAAVAIQPEMAAQDAARRARLATLGIGLGRDDLGLLPSQDLVRVLAPRLNCINCGAPHEPVFCSYCRTPHP